MCCVSVDETSLRTKSSSPYDPTVTRRGADKYSSLVWVSSALREEPVWFSGAVASLRPSADASSAAGPSCHPWRWMALAWPRPEDPVTGDRVLSRLIGTSSMNPCPSSAASHESCSCQLLDESMPVLIRSLDESVFGFIRSPSMNPCPGSATSPQSDSSGRHDETMSRLSEGAQPCSCKLLDGSSTIAGRVQNFAQEFRTACS